MFGNLREMFANDSLSHRLYIVFILFLQNLLAPKAFTRPFHEIHLLFRNANADGNSAHKLPPDNSFLTQRVIKGSQ